MDSARFNKTTFLACLWIWHLCSMLNCRFFQTRLTDFYKTRRSNAAAAIVAFEIRTQSIMKDAEHSREVNTDVLVLNRRYTLGMRRYTIKDLTDDAQSTIYQTIANRHAQGVTEWVAVTQVADFYHVDRSTAWFIWKPRRVSKDLTRKDQSSIYRDIDNLHAKGVGEAAALTLVAESHHVDRTTAWHIWKTRNDTTPVKASGAGIEEQKQLPRLPPNVPNVAVSTARIHAELGGNPSPGVSASVKSRVKKTSTPKTHQSSESHRVEPIRQCDNRRCSQVDQYYSRHVFLTEQRGHGPYGSDLEVCYPDWSSDDASDKENECGIES
jgi:hypothetical protein